MDMNDDLLIEKDKNNSLKLKMKEDNQEIRKKCYSLKRKILKKHLQIPFEERREEDFLHWN